VYSGGRRGPGAWEGWPLMMCTGMANSKAAVRAL